MSHYREELAVKALAQIIEEEAPLTAKDLGIPTQALEQFERDGLVQCVGRMMTNRPGRPPNLYWPTPKGKRFVKKNEGLALS